MPKRAPLRLLLCSTLYPSSVRPAHGIFVETRLRELLKSGEVDVRVIAPVPWFPFEGARFGEYGQFAATPLQEMHNGIEVHHPRYLLPPKVGMHMAPGSIARAMLPVARQLQAQGFDFQLIDAHYYYPDGVAAGRVAQALGKPFTVTARGTDLNLIPEHDRPRQLILDTAAAARASIGVCAALMTRLQELGADASKLHVLRNGVDLARFRPEDRTAARLRLGLPEAGEWLLSVGHLIERKGHDIAIRALPLLTEVNLAIVGTGPDQARLRSLAQELGLADRVRFAGLISNDQLRWWYSAANAMTLCSSREGWANVLLESMACGTPVVASNIWGTPEVVAAPEAGELMPQRTPQGLCMAYHLLRARRPARAEVRRYAEGFSWQATTQGQLQLFRQILEGKNA